MGVSKAGGNPVVDAAGKPPVSARAAIMLAGAVIAGVSGLHALGMQLVLPQLLARASEEAQEILDRHARADHENSVSRPEWQAIREQLIRIEERLDRLAK